jgi:hypothetical protein
LATVKITRVTVAAGVGVAVGVLAIALSESAQVTVTSNATAHIWVEDGAGTCPGGRASSQIDYASSASPDRRCGSIDQAWDAANAGDTIRMKAGDYDPQIVTGDKASETFVIGENGVTIDGGASNPVCGYQDGAFCANADRMTLENVTVDALLTHGVSNGLEVNGDNVTFRDVILRGEYASGYVRTPGFHWDGGEHGQTDGTPGQRWCDNGDGQPLQLENAGPATIEGVYFHPNGSNQTVTACGPTNGFHLETIRNQSTPNVTFRNNYFAACAEAGSGHIFWSGANAATGQVLEGNYFGAQCDGSSAAQNSDTLASCAFTWRYNTFEQPFQPTAPCATNGTWIGNAGVFHCGGTHANNVWIGSGTCSGDTQLGGTFSTLGLSATGRPQAGSAVIDAGQATCSTVTPDFDGTA